jgi:predicted Zn-dependent protease
MNAQFDPRDGASIAEFALLESQSPRCQIIVECVSHLDQRWARGSLTTNGSTGETSLTVIAFDDRPSGTGVATVTESVQSHQEVRDVVEAAVRGARLVKPAQDANNWPATAVDPQFADKAPILLPDSIAAPVVRLGDLLTWSGSTGIELFGYLEREMTTTWLATSAGTRLRHTQPRDRLEITAKSHARTRSTWHGFAATELSDGEWAQLKSDITQELTWQGAMLDLPPARRTTILPPSAIGDFILDLYWSAGARDANEGRSALHDDASASGTRIGQQIGGPGIRITSTPSDHLVPTQPFALSAGSGRFASVFDNGMPLTSTDWVRDGRLEHLISTGSDAHRLGIPHAPLIDNIRLDVAGSAPNVSALVSGLDDGLLLTCVWYNRTVDPQTMLLTGLTRDGVYVVRGGEVIGATSNFRFNDSPLSMLGRVTAGTAPARTLPREMADYANSVAMPAVTLEAMNFTSISEAR